MNDLNSTGIRITMRDFCRLPEDLRGMSDAGPVVATSRNGQRVFVVAVIIG